MITHLHISNYALIDKVDLEFGSGLTAITGETGSGKSILLGAFGLLLGDRADSKSIKDPMLKCIVEATFDIRNYHLQTYFEEHDLDYEGTTTIRREISPGGKSRAFINDTPVQLNILKGLGELLVDIHSQHENSILGQRDFQFSVVDSFAKNETLLKSYREVFDRYKKSKADLEETLSNEMRLRQDLDYMRFQWSELEKGELDSLHQESFEEELETLSNAENIKTNLQLVLGYLDGEAHGTLVQVNSAKSILLKLSGINNHLDEFAKRIEASLIELKDLHGEIEVYADNTHYDQSRIDTINTRLNLLYQLQQKHHMNSVSDLIVLRDELSQKIGGVSNFEERIHQLKVNLMSLENELRSIGKNITESRINAAKQTQKEIASYLTELHLEHAELKIDLTEAKEFTAHGVDDIQFLFRANKGGQLLPVRQVASGGEISRVMLAIKASIANHKKLPVLILDEIDQGVSGEVGRKIGIILKSMSESMQLLTITHLPQIAGKAEGQLKVFKTTTGNQTSTYVKWLSVEERVEELAEMLSGKSLTAAALENARELLSH
jgi:DNA repair protein RecN (Recombination protein N)